MAPKADKKAASSTDPSYEYKPDEIVLAKVKGYAAWPAHVVSPNADDVPAAVLKDRRGKDTYLVQFFPTGDLYASAWCTGRDLSLLTPREIDALLENPKKTKKDLLEGYKVARDPTEWKRERADKHAEYMELMAAAEAAKDELESDDGAEAAPKADGKKRKRPSAAGAKDGDKKKKPAKAPKSKGDADAAPASKKAKTTASTDDPAELVKSWRHKLQKVFLGKTNPPAAEMAHCGEYFDAMENFEMKEEWLRESKLSKVLKRIVLMKDGSIPEEDKYSFRERSAVLAAKWAPLLGADSPAPAKPESTNAAPEAANGAAEESKSTTEENGTGAATEQAENKADEPPAAAEPSEDKPAAMDVEGPAPNTNGDAAPAAAVEEQPEENKPAEEQPPAAAAAADAEPQPAAADSEAQNSASSA
ncbi:hypothetical protein C6P46_004086 [Rhodotorula mucilaginosa]|uniref:PWWP domain-containing protein n=1 Tax=Rhodotorula mucilaginosa TaxID=5537 RepID=A0A9P7B5W0_RHOMI|nr:hypothetical protein C6P46_004086 [Rhodotorula mucilaginosa]